MSWMLKQMWEMFSIKEPTFYQDELVENIRHLLMVKRLFTIHKVVEILFPHPETPAEVKQELSKKVNNDVYSLAKFIKCFAYTSQEQRDSFFSGSVLEGIEFPTGLDGPEQDGIQYMVAQVTHFNEKEVLDMADLFEKLCDPGTHKLTKLDFESLLEGVINSDLITSLFNAFNIRGNGCVNFMEFVCGFSSMIKGPETERLKFFANIFDADNDEYLTSDDIQKFCDAIFLCNDFRSFQKGETDASRTSLFDFLAILMSDEMDTNRAKILQLEDTIFTKFLNYDLFNRITPSPSPPSVLEFVTTIEQKGLLPTLGAIRNIGNSCYLGSALQCIANLDRLSAALRNLKSNLLPDETLTKAYLNILEKITTPVTINPTEFKRVLLLKTPLFGDKIQHDCQELIITFLDLLKMELRSLCSFDGFTNLNSENGLQKDNNSNQRKHFDIPSDDANKREQSEINGSDSNHDGFSVSSFKNFNVIDDLFSGQLVSSLHCSNCGHTSSITEPYTMLQLEVPTDQRALVFIHVVNGSNVKKYAFRVDNDTLLSEFKEMIARDIGISLARLRIIVLDKCGKFNINLSNCFNSLNSQLKDLPLNAIDICCFDESTECSVVVTCVHRRFIYSKNYLVKEIDGVETQTFGYPFLLALPTSSSINGTFLYHSVMNIVQNLFSDSKAQNSKIVRNRAVDADENSCSGYPFELAFTRGDASWCASCSWKKFCRGCRIDPEETKFINPKYLTSPDILLSVRWRPLPFYLRAGTYFDFETSVHACIEAQKKIPTLHDCLREFTKPEILMDSRCEMCERIGTQKKSLRLMKLPRILIIHLKRFVYVPSLARHVKQQIPVDFPLDELDLSVYCGVMDDEKKVDDHDSQSFRFKCTGVVIHQGQLTHGHYTTYIRDRRIERWVFYNDEHYKILDEGGKFSLKDAYVVFYETLDSSSQKIIQM